MAALIFATVNADAQSKIDDKVSIDKVIHDFGDIYVTDGPVSCTFTITNTGSTNMVILSVVPSCGCTEAEWTREPIAPGKKGTISTTYKNEDGPYPFDKTLTVYFSDVKKPAVLHLRGSVHQAAKPLKERYTLMFGNFGVKDVEMKVGNLSQRETKSVNYVIANNGVSPMKIEFKDVSEGMKLEVFPNPVPAKSTATLVCTIEASRKRWGKNWYYATPVVDGRVFKAAGKLPASEEEDGFYKEKNSRLGLGKSEIGFWACTKENVAGLPKEEVQNGPVTTFAKSTAEFGKVASGEKKTLTFEYTNSGKKELKLFKLDADCSNVTIKQMDETTAAGKKSSIVVELDTKGMPKGENIIVLNLYTNSPLRPVVPLQIAGTIL